MQESMVTLYSIQMTNHSFVELATYDYLYVVGFTTVSWTITSTTLIYTSVKIIKNEVGCRDDTMPKTVETRRHCEED